MNHEDSDDDFTIILGTHSEAEQENKILNILIETKENIEYNITKIKRQLDRYEAQYELIEELIEELDLTTEFDETE